MITEKRCKQCDQTKPVRQFHLKSDNADGYYSICKACRRLNDGHSKRHQPTPDPGPQVTFELVVQDVINLSLRTPSNILYRKAAEKLKADPYGQHEEFVNDLVYRCWEARLKQQVCFDELDETCPVISEKKSKSIEQREFTNMDSFLF